MSQNNKLHRCHNLNNGLNSCIKTTDFTMNLGLYKRGNMIKFLKKNCYKKCIQSQKKIIKQPISYWEMGQPSKR